MDNFLKKMEDVLEDFLDNNTEFTMSINVAGNVLDIPPHSDNWEQVTMFIDNLMKEDDEYDEYIEFKENMEDFNI